MKTMAEIQYIKHLYENEEKSLRQIAQITNTDFRTVQKYAHQSNWSLDKLPNMNPETYPAMGSYIRVVDEWLEQDQREPRKQRHTIKRVYERLRDEHAYLMPTEQTSISSHLVFDTPKRAKDIATQKTDAKSS